MMKPSQNYLSDPDVGMPTTLITKLDEAYFEQLPNLNTPHPKLLVVFSGGNALGKSTLAHKLETDLHGLILENDAIKSILKNALPDAPRELLNTYTWQYCQQLYKNINHRTPNGLVIRDGVIDWYFDRILPIFFAQDYTLFVIGYDISIERNRQLIEDRGDRHTVSTKLLLERITEHKIHMARFRAAYPVDIMLTDENIFDHERVTDAVRKRLEQLSAAKN